MATVEIYTSFWCPYCVRAKRLLDGKGVQYTEIDAPQGSPAREQARQRAGGRTSVPQVFINGRHIGGSDDLAAMDRAGGLDALLSA